MQRRATYGWKENEATSTGRNKQRYPQANSAAKTSSSSDSHFVDADIRYQL